MKQAELSVRHALRYYEWRWQHTKVFTTLQFSSSTIVAYQIQHSITLQLGIETSWLGFCHCDDQSPTVALQELCCVMIYQNVVNVNEM